MADKVQVTFSMTDKDLVFLMWAMDFLEGGPHNRDAECREWAYQFRRAIDDNFEEVEAAAEVLEYEGIMTTCDDESDWRLPRLQRVIGYVCAIQGNRNVLNKVKAVHDHEGTLTVKWKEEPSGDEQEMWTAAWCSVIGDRTDTVEHEVLEAAVQRK